MASATAAGIAAGRRAFGPDLLEPHRNALDPLAHQARVAVAEIFGADVDDPAGVDHIIGRIEDAARRAAARRPRASPAGCWRRRRRPAPSARRSSPRSRIAPSALGLSTSASRPRISSARHDLAAGRVGELLRLGLVDVGDRSASRLPRRREARRRWRRCPRPAARCAGPSRLSLPSARFTAALMPRNTPSEVCGPGSPPTSPALELGKPGDELGRARDLDHVGDAHPDVLGGDVAAAEMRRPPCRRRGAGRASWCALSSARITALPPPSGRPAIAFL